MSIRTKRIIALSVCLLLLSAAIFQNIRNNGKNKNANKNDKKDGIIVNDDDENDNKTGEVLDAEEFFAGARIERESQRSLSEAQCVAVIGNQEASEEEKAAAAEAQLAIEMMNELEADMETSIKGRGYADVFVELDETGYVFVTVMAEELTEQEVGVLAEIVLDTTNVSIEQISVKNIF